jgi:hypothetical protein
MLRIIMRVWLYEKSRGWPDFGWQKFVNGVVVLSSGEARPARSCTGPYPPLISLKLYSPVSVTQRLLR